MLSRTLHLAIMLVSICNLEAARAASCDAPPGFIAGPFVPDENVARDIFKAVSAALAPFNAAEYPLIVIEDRGNYWWASQAKVETQHGILRFGGGQLYMQIDKCTGAISRAAFNR